MKGKRDRGFTLIELLIVVAIISIIAAFAVPGLLRARMTGNETSAIASLKVVTSSQVAYSASCGQNGYATTFVILGTPAPGTTEGFVSADLGTVVAPQKSGYNFTLTTGAGATAGPNDCNGTATTTAYYAAGVPQTFGTTGARSFATNASNTIWQLAAAAAPAEPFGPPAMPIQ
jgi:prepilin-type N-terminal cleavage/methylation domain-containing protein